MARKVPLLSMAGKPGFVTAWYVLGPFKSGCTDGEDVTFLSPKHTRYWDLDLCGEKTCRPRAGKTVKAQGLSRNWQAVVTPYFQWLEPERIHSLDPAKKEWLWKEAKFKWWEALDSISYAAAYIYSESAREALAHAGGWDGYKLWFNGEFLGQEHSWHHQILDQQSYVVSLKKGMNLFLLKIDRSRVMLRLTDLGGFFLKGVSSALPDGTDKNTLVFGSEASYDAVDTLRRVALEFKPSMPAPLSGKKSIGAWQKKFGRVLKGLLLPEGPSKGKLHIRKLSSSDEGEYLKEKIELWKDGSFSRIPAFVLVPKKKNGAGMVGLHGHGKGKIEVVEVPDPRPAGSCWYDNSGVAYAKRGYVVIAIDALGFGERESPGFDNCQILHTGVNLIGKDLISYHLQDYITAVDYLCSRKDVDSKRIGCAGNSFGGVSAYMLAAVDKRIRACIASCCTTSYTEFLQELEDFVCGSQVLKSVFKYGDISDIMSLIAPRALFIEAGKLDYLFSLHFAEEADKKVRRVYAELNAAEKYGSDFFDGGHRFNGAKSHGWTDKQLV